MLAQANMSSPRNMVVITLQVCTGHWHRASHTESVQV